MSFVLGVTGGIASGKSTVIRFFQDYGFPIVDGDLIARKIVEPKTEALAKITAYFGQAVLQTDGSLNRKHLGQLIFSDPQKRKKLDEIMDPYLRQAILAEIKSKSQNYPLVVADMPLMYEADYDQYMDQIAVVYVPYQIQKKRLMKRNNLTEKEAEKRIASQMSLEEKKNLADIVFDNQFEVACTKKQVENWLKQQGFI